jgi:hypothetical protein
MDLVMTVFLVQNTKWIDQKDGRLKSKFDFTAATQFGELHELLAPSASPFDLPPVVHALQIGLANFSNQDYLLLVGSPVIIGCAVAIAASYNDGQVGMLQWSGAKRQYIPARAFGL